MVPSADVLPTLISELEELSNKSVPAALLDSCLNSSHVTCFVVLVPPLATSTRLVEGPSVGGPASFLSRSLR